MTRVFWLTFSWVLGCDARRKNGTKRVPRAAVGHWRVAYVHVPKCGGSSVGYSLARRGVAACKSRTRNFEMCECKSRVRRCEEGLPGARINDGARVAVMELEYAAAKRVVAASRYGYSSASASSSSEKPWLWVGVVRRPSEWFYSAVAQFCHHLGRSNAGCVRNATLDVLRDAGWFDGVALALAKERPEFYFDRTNYQTHMLLDVALEPHWLVCALPRLKDVYQALWRVLRLPERPTTVEAPWTLETYTHAGGASLWPPITAFAEGVPWRNVSRFYAHDTRFYDDLERAGGCAAHTHDYALRAVLKLQFGAIDWH